METHLQVAAGAEDALNVAIACQLETAEALVRVEHDECSAAARQAVDLLILTQAHIAEVPLLVAPEVPDNGARTEPSGANGVLTRQRDGNRLTPTIEPSLVPARDTGDVNLPLEDNAPRPAIGISLPDLIGIRRNRSKQTFWGNRGGAGPSILNEGWQLARAAHLARCRRSQVHGVETRQLLPDHVDRHHRIMLCRHKIGVGLPMMAVQFPASLNTQPERFADVGHKLIVELLLRPLDADALHVLGNSIEARIREVKIIWCSRHRRTELIYQAIDICD